MSGIIWIIATVFVPIAVAWKDGSNYGSALTLIGLGVVFYVINGLLMAFYLRRRAPGSIEDGSWESTAGTGVVPHWVSKIGGIGIGIFIAGSIIALLLLVGVVGENEKAVLGIFELHRSGK